MPNDTVASLLDDAIKRSGLSNQEVAERLGFEAGNMIELMRQGATQVPVRTLFHVPGFFAPSFKTVTAGSFPCR